MVAPFAVDLQIALGLADFAEAEFCQEVPAGAVLRDAGGIDAVEPQALEGVRQQHADGVGHVAVIGVFLAHPVAEIGGLRDAAADVVEVHAAEQAIIRLAKDVETVAEVEAPFLQDARDAVAKHGAFQRVVAPGGFPGLEEAAAPLAHRRPLLVVGAGRRAQIGAFADQLEPRETVGTEERQHRGALPSPQARRRRTASRLGTWATGPNEARVGDEAKMRLATRAMSDEPTASILATISSAV